MSTTVPFQPLPLDQAEIVYEYGPDSVPDPAVARGDVEEIRLTGSDFYPGTSRTIWIHRPAGLPSDVEAGVMFFNDGWWYLDPDGDVRGGTVLDNLSAAGAIPPVIGVFVDPGIRDEDGQAIKNRNVEYDAADSRYADFLIEDVLPLVRSRHRISENPSMRGICGGSSGGNAALTAAWNRPDAIGRVITFNASFAQMPHGNPYPKLLAEEPPRNLRVFVHAARRDLNWNRSEDNWFAENLETAAALARAGYDMRLVVGDGGHSPNHGGVLLPDALRWLWR
ncbi:alpha/beta hydrolase [Leifsonia poae]|uniref:alpha/beta hydrolase n=1 Tax=Leifsonia poae TaxID=110933 RepID=UPI003D68E25F